MKWGYGVYSWNSGSVYKGFFEKDLRHGYGDMFWPDDNVYRGWWKNGVQHGKGELFVINEGLMKGIFNNNYFELFKLNLYIIYETNIDFIFFMFWDN